MNNKLPSGDEKFDVRILRIGVAPPGEPVFSERATAIEIEDESSGEYVRVSQASARAESEKWTLIDPGEWPVLRDAVDFMIEQCRK